MCHFLHIKVALFEAGVGNDVVCALRRHIASTSICGNACGLLACLARENKGALHRAAAGEAAIAALHRHAGDAWLVGACAAALKALGELELNAVHLQRAGADVALVAALQRCENSAEACAAVCEATATIACTRKSRRGFDAAGASAPIARVMRRHAENVQLLLCKAGGAALAAIGGDERTVLYVAGARAGSAAVEAMLRHPEDAGVTVCEEGAGLLELLAGAHLNCRLLLDCGAVGACTSAVRTHGAAAAELTVQRSLDCLYQMFAAADDDDSALRRRICIAAECADAGSVVTAALQREDRSAHTYTLGTALLGRLADVEARCTSLHRGGAVEAAVTALRQAGDYRDVATSACALLASIAACSAFRIAVRDLGVAEALAAALSAHSDDDALVSAACLARREVHGGRGVAAAGRPRSVADLGSPHQRSQRPRCRPRRRVRCGCGAGVHHWQRESGAAAGRGHGLLDAVLQCPRRPCDRFKGVARPGVGRSRGSA